MTTSDRTEITKLREQVAAQAAVIEKLREALTACVCAMQDYQAGIGITEIFDRSEELGRKALALPADNAQILEEVRRAERERCIYVINAQKNPITTSYANGLVFDPANNMIDKCAAAIREME